MDILPDVTGKIPAFFVGDTGIGLEMRDDVMTPAMKGQAGALGPELQIKYTVPSVKKLVAEAVRFIRWAQFRKKSLFLPRLQLLDVFEKA